MKKPKLYFIIYDGSCSYMVCTDEYEEDEHEYYLGYQYDDKHYSQPYRTFSLAKSELKKYANEALLDAMAFVKNVSAMRKSFTDDD